MIISNGSIVLKRPLKYDQMTISFVKPEEFYKSTKEYLRNIFQCMGIDEKKI